MSKLIIAEKPSMGKAIAETIGIRQNKDGYIECDGNAVVTYAVGHLFEQAGPDAYLPNNVPVSQKTGKKAWRLADLPIIPNRWIMSPKDPAAKKQLSVIGSLIKKSDTVIHAGDPDREGQAIVDEILDHFGWKGETYRVWLAALDRENVKKAMSAIKPNRNYAPLWLAQQARSRTDWLVGMNLTRKYTIESNQLTKVGRVKTPTLAIVVRREREILAFKPKDYFEPTASFLHENGKFSAKWKAPEDFPGLDPENRIVNRQTAEAIANAAKDKPGRISSAKVKPGKQEAHLPYSLSALQKACSSRFGLSAQEVLDIAQSLYIKKVTSYPRTDCQYLPEEQHSGSADILKKLSGTFPQAKGATASLHHSAWNSKKVTAHHAIIPTGATANLDAKESKVYGMIAEAYIALFYPHWQFEDTELLVACGGHTWKATGRRTLSKGWKSVFTDDEDGTGAAENGGRLPKVANGDPVSCVDAKVEAKQTVPPKRYTDGTLIECMSNIYRFVDDPKARAVLKETSGIGTEATRAAIIEDLVKNGMLVREKKTFRPTDRGMDLIDAMEKIDSPLVDPVLTAQWEDKLADIANGKLGLDAFMSEHISTLKTWMEKSIAMKASGPPCPDCGKPLRRLNGKFGFFWGCSSYPECNATFQDDKGKAGARKSDTASRQPIPPMEDAPVCPACTKTKLSVMKTGRGKDYYRCQECRTAFWMNNDDQVGSQWPDRPAGKPAKGRKTK